MRTEIDKLKTLKDLEMHDDFGIPYVELDDLRAEAVKWVKQLNELESTEDGESSAQINFIIRFFNLSEEDLK